MDALGGILAATATAPDTRATIGSRCLYSSWDVELDVRWAER
jgi:hypothetical protein